MPRTRRRMPSTASRPAAGSMTTVSPMTARRRLSHGYGRRRVVADLVSRGVDAETVNRTAAALGEGQADAVRIAADRLRRGHSGPLTDAEVRRLAAALQRRGFDMGDIRTVLRQLATESAAPLPDEP